MKSWQMTAWGIQNLALNELSEPSPGPGEVLVRIHAVSLNYRDLLMVRGLYNPRLALPLSPCSDAAGQVVKLGAGVTKWKEGDRVMPTFAQSWLSGRLTRDHMKTTLGGPLEGTLSQYRVLPVDALVAIPDHLNYEQASTLPCAAVTAWNALFAHGQLKPGESVLIQGTGGVSIFALQFAKMAGARVIVTSSSDEKLAMVKAMGADHTLNYAQTPEWGRAVRQVFAEGVDHIVEVGGSGTLTQSSRAAACGGSIYMIGVLSQQVGTAHFDPTPILMQNIRIQGIFVGAKDTFVEMAQAVAHNGLEPVISDVFDFGDAPAAFEHMAAAGHFGKIVISMAE